MVGDFWDELAWSTIPNRKQNESMIKVLNHMAMCHNPSFPHLLSLALLGICFHNCKHGPTYLLLIQYCDQKQILGSNVHVQLDKKTNKIKSWLASVVDCASIEAKNQLMPPKFLQTDWLPLMFVQPKNRIVCKVWGLFWLYLPPYLRTASLPFWQLWTAANRKHCLWQNPKSGRRSKYNFLLSQIWACKPAQVSGLHLKCRDVQEIPENWPFHGQWTPWMIHFLKLCEKGLSWGYLRWEGAKWG